MSFTLDLILWYNGEILIGVFGVAKGLDGFLIASSPPRGPEYTAATLPPGADLNYLQLSTPGANAV